MTDEKNPGVTGGELEVPAGQGVAEDVQGEELEVPERVRVDVEALTAKQKQFVANWCFWSLTMDELIEMGLLTGPRINRGNVLLMQESLTSLGFERQEEVGPECIIEGAKKLPL